MGRERPKTFDSACSTRAVLNTLHSRYSLLVSHAEKGFMTRSTGPVICLNLFSLEIIWLGKISNALISSDFYLLYSRAIDSEVARDFRLTSQLATTNASPRSRETSATFAIQVFFLAIFKEIWLSSHIKTYLSVRYALDIHSSLINRAFKGYPMYSLQGIKN